MKTVTIYLRSFEDKGKSRLSLFDSNRNSGLDDLVTEVPAGAVIIWKLDCLSGIKNITRIYSKTGKRNVFKSDPKKRLLLPGFYLRLTEDAEGEEAYGIDFILCDGRPLTIDPYIRVKPPQT